MRDEEIVIIQKKLKRNKIVSIILMAIVIIVFALVVGNTIMEDKESSNQVALPYSDQTIENDYIYFDAQYLSNSVSYFESYEKAQFYIALTKELVPYLVCINDKDFDRFQAIYDYTYDDTITEVPEPVRIKGYAVTIGADLAEYAVDGIHSFMNDGVVTTDNYTDYFGNYYVNVTDTPLNSSDVKEEAGVEIFIALVLCGLIYLIRKAADKSAKNKIEKLNVSIAAIANSVPGQDSDYSLNAYGNSHNIREDLFEEPEKGNSLLGVIGAILGAALGGVVWVMVMQIGYIVGIVGVLIVFLSVTGYQKFSKSDAKAGRIISIIIALLMIVVANYAGYVLEYYQAIKELTGGNGSLIDAIALSPEMMAQNRVWASFLGDLAIGLILSLVAGYRYIFSGNKEKGNKNKR